jgi:acetylglutamate kinase
MKFVVKLGGAGLENPALLEGCTRAIADLVRDGHQVAVVHGGGVQLTRTLKAWASRASSSPAFASPMPRPATSPSWSSPAKSTNPSSPRSARSASPQSASPAAMACSSARARSAASMKPLRPTLASSARSPPATRAWLDAVWKLNAVPVLSSMALGFDGEYYNINADEMAAACAIACRADALVFLTDVPGVKGANGEVLRWLSIDQIAEMAKSAVISGGMLPKLSACREALLNGVKRVRILPAEAAGSLPDLCSSRVAQGTEVMVA